MISVVGSVEDLAEDAASCGSKRDRRKVLIFVGCLLGREVQLFGFVCQARRGSGTGPPKGRRRRDVRKSFSATFG